jgi:CO/xanthine dehydrogenase FAD-binding subunit
MVEVRRFAVVNEFKYLRPQTLPEALELLGTQSCRILAGGTDLLIQLNRGLEQRACLLDIKEIDELQKFSYIPGNGLLIGSAITVNKIAAAPEVAANFPALRDAAKSLASHQLRNRATVVGNLCNASPAADLAPPLLVYDAIVHIASKPGVRSIPISEFFCGPKQTVLSSEEMVIAVFIPDVSDGDQSIYLKQTRIKGHDLGIVGVAARLTSVGRILLALSSVAPTPIRLNRLEELLAQEKNDLANWAAAEVLKYIAPISDVRSSAEYRKHIAGVLVARAISNLLAGEVE